MVHFQGKKLKCFLYYIITTPKYNTLDTLETKVQITKNKLIKGYSGTI